MTRTLTAVVLTITLGWTTVAEAREVQSKVADPAPPEAVARFVMGTRLGYITCSGKYRSYLEKLDLYTLVNEGQSNPRMSEPSNEAASACVHETLLKGRSLYSEAARNTAAGGRTALQEYMTSWEASLTALQPKQREKLREFDVRHKKQEARLDQLQAQLEAKAR